MSSKMNESRIVRLLRLMSAHGELLEEIYQQREIYYGPEDIEMHDRLAPLRRERIVRLEPDAGGGINVRLTRDIRLLFNMTTQERRLQNIGVGVSDALEKIDHLAGTWKIAVFQERDEEAEINAYDEITEILWDIESQYDEQLEGLQERISVAYGFDDVRRQRARDFEFYMARLKDMVRGANTLLDRLQDEEQYAGVDPINRIAMKLSERFRRHGAVINRLHRELERYIVSTRPRQKQTRLWIRRQRWLKRQNGPLKFPAAETAADTLPLLRRAVPIALSGRSDLGDPRMTDTWVKMLTTLISRRQQQKLARKKVAREDSGQRMNTAEEERLAQERLLEAKQRDWQSKDWIKEYLRLAIKATQKDPDSAGLSALQYWKDKLSTAAPDEPRPTLRAWLHEVDLMVVTNRPVAGQPFLSRFQFCTTPTFHAQLAREELMLRDILVRARPEAMRRRKAA